MAQAARRKAWNEANKERRAATQKARYEADKERISAYRRAYYVANKEHTLAVNRAWAEVNKESMAAYQKAWAVANKDHLTALNKVWNEANKERRTATSKVWYEANKEHKAAAQKVWNEANPEKVRAKTARHRARKLRATPPWQDLDELAAIWANCPEGFHVDHIHPLKGKASTGLHVPWNLNYLPDAENMSKGNKTPQPGYLDWFSEAWTIHAPPTGRVWTPTDYDNI